MAVSEFFTTTSIASLTVAAAAVNMSANTLRRIFKIPAKISAFAAGLLIAYLNVYIMSEPHWAEWVLAFWNACLLFCTAMGMNDVVETSTVMRGFMYDQESEREAFFSSWHRQ